MKFSNKRSSEDINIDQIQENNRTWWSQNNMSYDWKNKIKNEKYSRQWFDEIDRRFVFGARLFGHNKTSFDNIIPFESLKGKKVLEIGCGMGLHTELLIKGGAEVYSIDISDESILATKKRLKLKGVNAISVKKMDACNIKYSDNFFDFVWSWGVIHHSARTVKIIKEINRVLKTDGEARVMVYNLNGIQAYRIIILRYLFGFWKDKSIEDCLWSDTDGYMARYYSKDQFEDIFRAFFSNVESVTLGQDSDGLPLPRQLRMPLLRLFGEKFIKKRANKRGFFLFLTASNCEK